MSKTLVLQLNEDKNLGKIGYFEDNGVLVITDGTVQWYTAIPISYLTDNPVAEAASLPEPTQEGFNSKEVLSLVALLKGAKEIPKC